MTLIKSKIIQALGIEVKQSSIHGLGVFARQKFRKGELIEKSPIILLDKTERELLQLTSLFSYYFILKNDKTPAALGLGLSSLYNHSYNANAFYGINAKKAIIIFKSVTDINAGEEITINYNGRPFDPSPVYFPPELSQ